MSKKNELAPESTASAALLSQLEDVQTDGFENVTQEDLGLAIINLLQGTSPQCDKTKDGYIEGCEAGEFFVTTLQESFKELTVVPVGFMSTVIEWVPRESGGGFVGRYPKGHPKAMDFTKVGYKKITPEGNELVDTAEHFVMVLPEGGGEPYLAVMPFKSTATRYSKNWINKMSAQSLVVGGVAKRLPMFMQMYKLTAGVDRNTKGSWYSPKNMEYLGHVPDELLAKASEAAKAFNDTSIEADAAFSKSAPVGGTKVEIIDGME